MVGGVCYRPETDEQFMLNKICSSINNTNNDNCVLLGDFNFRNINWSSLTCSSLLGTQFLETLSGNLLNQMVTSPTREKIILDLVLVNDPSQITDLQVLEHFGHSDHNIISFGIQCPIPRLVLYSQGDYEGLNSELEDLDWDSTFHRKSLQQCWDKFKEIYETLIFNVGVLVYPNYWNVFMTGLIIMIALQVLT